MSIAQLRPIFLLVILVTIIKHVNCDTINAYDPVGVFLNRAMWERAKTRGQNATTPFFKFQYNQIINRANLAAIPTPWRMDNLTRPVADGGIIYGWGSSGLNNSLSYAGDQFNNAGYVLQALALAYTFTQDIRYAQKAVSYAMTWAAVHTPVNMYDFHIDFANSKFDDSTSPDRPWNFALDDMWSTYGLMCVADAYMLLTKAGYTMTTADNASFRLWIQKVAASVNSGLHSWTRWADTHSGNPSSTSYIRYRSDNHISWAQRFDCSGGCAW